MKKLCQQQPGSQISRQCACSHDITLSVHKTHGEWVDVPGVSGWIGGMVHCPIVILCSLRLREVSGEHSTSQSNPEPTLTYTRVRQTPPWSQNTRSKRWLKVIFLLSTSIPTLSPGKEWLRIMPNKNKSCLVRIHSLLPLLTLYVLVCFKPEIWDLNDLAIAL